MKTQPTRIIAIAAASATLITGLSLPAIASATEPVTGETVAVSATMNSDALLSSLPPDVRDAFTDLCATGLLSKTEQYEVLQQLVDATAGPQTYSKLSAIKKAVSVISKIFKGVKWLDKFTGFLDDVENWSENKIAGFLENQGVSSSTAHTVAKIIVSILL